ncbi:uncharacterized protein MONBRDRAFT_29319 [Monosiga brevicollis MX1]|uniref:GOLD domain-containing protein n=1 Tax=Monosiga brevicollis TaxID=81824 RepID=A9VAR7_MONBE|nr:uncharacterized protein MONBRDRAFT_29319 [Monosiga brevicollis MX1]EDQ85422.1 predicted protein [Monosiga brevicollis MX1]|eukprot:XP_001749833.1 hypothetical protein [Monosiga brevicollis MX1]
MVVERHTRLAAAALLVLSALYVPAWAGSELTFDMSPHQEQCFYEQVERGVSVSVDFQVVYGGRLDIDVEVREGQNIIWSQQRAQSGDHTFTATRTGEHAFCFSNKFSTVAHKTVYIDVVVGDDEPVLDQDGLKHQTALTQLETSLVNIHDSLKRVSAVQSHLRLREASHRHTADFMNERVQWVSASELLVLVGVAIFQVFYLRSLFTNKPDR